MSRSKGKASCRPWHGSRLYVLAQGIIIARFRHSSISEVGRCATALFPGVEYEIVNYGKIGPMQRRASEALPLLTIERCITEGIVDATARRAKERTKFRDRVWAEWSTAGGAA